MFKTSSLVVGNENRFRAVFSFFYQFLTVLTNFQFLCCLAILSFLRKFSIISSVLGQFWSKNSSFCQKILFCCLVMKTLSRLFSVCLNSFWRFWPLFSFCIVGAVFVVFRQQVLTGIKAFWKILVKETIFR